MSSSKPSAIVVSAPSGTGKTTLNHRLIAEHDFLMMSISYTTRPIRHNEKDGVDYHFVDESNFQKQLSSGKMLETANVFGKFYGTSMLEIERIQALGKTPLLEIDVQGWIQIKEQASKEKLLDAKSIFIFPPSIKDLWKRLVARASDKRQVQWNRICAAKEEITEAKHYEYFVVNKELQQAYADMSDIVIHNKPGKLSHQASLEFVDNLLAEYEEPWFQELTHEFQGQ